MCIAAARLGVATDHCLGPVSLADHDESARRDDQEIRAYLWQILLLDPPEIAVVCLAPGHRRRLDACVSCGVARAVVILVQIDEHDRRSGIEGKKLIDLRRGRID
jgi:hypothetical protein